MGAVRGFAVSIHFFAWLPCTLHAPLRSSLLFSPFLEADIRPEKYHISILLSLNLPGCCPRGKGMPDGAWNLERQLYAFIEEFTKAGRGFDFFWPVCPKAPLFQRTEGSQIVHVCFPAWPCSMACKRTFCGRSDL